MNDYINDYFKDIYWYFEDTPEPDDRYPTDEDGKVFDSNPATDK